MKKVETLLFARWLIPIEPESLVLENQALVFENGRIADIFPMEEAKQRYQANETVMLDHHIVMPGLVNAHTHSPMVLLRGFGDDLPLMEWLNQVIWPVERRFLNETFVREGTELALAEMIRSGTTCFNEHYFFPEVIANVVDQVGLRARIGILLIETEHAWAKNLEESLKKGLSLLEAYPAHPLISIGLAPHAPYSLSDESLKKIHSVVTTYKLPLHVHMHETHTEIEQGYLKDQKRPLKRLYDAGLISQNAQLVHMTQVDSEDIQILKETGASVIHCPSSNLKLASGVCPVQALLDEGIPVGLGTDGAASNNTVDMFQAIYLAALLGKLAAGQASAVSAMDTLKLATLHGAQALGLDHDIGSLRIGKSADVIAIDIDCLNAQPLYHPISHVVYAMNSRQVSDVWVKGRRLLKSGKLTTLDEVSLLKKAKGWREKLVHEQDVLYNS